MTTPSADTRSMDSRTESWIRKNFISSLSVSTISSKSTSDYLIEEDIRNILDKSVKGKMVLEFYKKRRFLNSENRKINKYIIM